MKKDSKTMKSGSGLQLSTFSMVVFAGIAVMLVGFFIAVRLHRQKRMMVGPEPVVEVMEQAPAGTMDESTGEVNEAAFEKNQAVSSDTSLDTIEAETNNTVILKEDYSNL